MAAKRNGIKKLDLALQGGGAHGAFTWGVLDYFLEQDNLWLEGICGTSAGAVNGVLLAYGLHLGKMEEGRQVAKEKLHAFWKTVSDRSEFSPFRPSWYDKAFGGGNMDNSPGYFMIQMMSQFSSPYEFNPGNMNPMRDLLLELIDFDELRNAKDQQVFVCATNVRRGRPKVFPLKEISVEAVLASTCLPYLFQAVTIDGEDYWDGGYMGNPPIYPLIDRTDCGDILIVQINPINIRETPRTANEIQDRINELSFNSSLMLEMRRIASIDKLMEEGAITDKQRRFKDLRFHVINPEKHIAHLNVSSKMNTDWDYLTWLRDTGRAYAKEWLDANYDKIGLETTVDIRATYL